MTGVVDDALHGIRQLTQRPVASVTPTAILAHGIGTVSHVAAAGTADLAGLVGIVQTARRVISLELDMQLCEH